MRRPRRDSGAPAIADKHMTDEELSRTLHAATAPLIEAIDRLAAEVRNLTVATGAERPVRPEDAAAQEVMRRLKPEF